MKIHSMSPKVGRNVRRWIAVCGTVVIGAAGGSGFGQVPQGKPGSAAGSALSSVSVQDGRVMRDGESFQVIGSSSVPTAASGSRGPSGQDVPVPLGPGEEIIQWEGSGGPNGIASECSSCGNRCGGACGRTRRHARGRRHARAGSLAGGGGYLGGGLCGGNCEPYWYVNFEALYMRQTENDGFTLSDSFRLDEFDYEVAPRVTIGSVPNCVDGWEVSYTSPLEWDMSARRVIGSDDLGTRLTAAGLLDADDDPIDPSFDDIFGNASSQTQQYRAEYWNLELNRTLIAQDAAKLLYGIRYLDYEEDFRYLSSGSDGTGVLSSSVDNTLIGGQIGMDILYPIARRMSVDIRGRAGAYLNLSDSDVNLNVDGATFGTDADDESLAGVFEFGSGVRYEVNDAVALRGGGELWYLAGMATAPQQIPNVLTPSLGREIDNDDEILVVGVTLGAEVRY